MDHFSIYLRFNFTHSTIYSVEIITATVALMPTLPAIMLKSYINIAIFITINIHFFSIPLNAEVFLLHKNHTYLLSFSLFEENKTKIFLYFLF